MNAMDHFYQEQTESTREVLLALKATILKQDRNICAVWKYGMPFFTFKGKMFCYLWVHKKTKLPYIGLVEGKYFDEPDLLQEHRSRMKIMMVDESIDLPINRINQILQKAIKLYKDGTIKI